MEGWGHMTIVREIINGGDSPVMKQGTTVTEFIGFHNIPYIFLSPDSQPYLSINEFLTSLD